MPGYKYWLAVQCLHVNIYIFDWLHNSQTFSTSIIVICSCNAASHLVVRDKTNPDCSDVVTCIILQCTVLNILYMPASVQSCNVLLLLGG